ncbi:MAG: YihY/virulence factor BrkB family protein [Flavobacteriales bacterium]|nr:YihY/virulence factor BrkB family protein [Flavobacteriales bacterium]
MWQRLRRKFLYSGVFRRLMRWSHRIVLPGFEGFDLYRISRFFFAALAKGQIAIRASAIAFKLFLAFFPAVIVLLTLIPYVPIDDFQNKLLGTFQDMMPIEVFRFIEQTLHDLVKNRHGALLSVSFVMGVYLASNSIDAIMAGFSSSSNITKWHSPFKQRLLSLGLLVALAVLMMVGIPLLTLSGIAIRTINEYGYISGPLQVYALFAVKWVISILIVITSVSLLYNAGDPGNKRFRLVTPGTLLAVFLILIVSQALAFVFSNITDYNALYGSIGAILAVQLWFYFNMIAILTGYELNTSISRARGLRRTKLEVPPEQPS